MGRARLSSAVLMGALALSGAQVSAQTMLAEAGTFDPARAILSDTPMFDAFYPTSTTRLADALDDRVVRDDTGVLVMDVAGQKLALVTRQMSYHHVAQGELAGEPWMVTF